MILVSTPVPVGIKWVLYMVGLGWAYDMGFGAMARQLPKMDFCEKCHIFWLAANPENMYR